jgi:hypothetical protein
MGIRTTTKTTLPSIYLILLFLKHQGVHVYGSCIYIMGTSRTEAWIRSKHTGFLLSSKVPVVVVLPKEEGLKGKRGDDIEDAVGDLVGPL